MTEQTIIGGAVNNGHRVPVVFPFYSGSASLCYTDGKMQVAFFALSFKPKLPVAGIVDGRSVMAIEVAQTGVNDIPKSNKRLLTMQAVIVTVVPAPSR